jgi:hypothetical protein
LKKKISLSKGALAAAGYIEVSPGRFAKRPAHKLTPSGSQSNKKVVTGKGKASKPDLFVLLVKQELGIDLVTEYKFHPDRRWRFDYACPELKIAVEQEGGIWRKGGGAHSRPANIIRDMEKYTQASVMGWVVIRRTPSTLKSSATMRLIEKAIATKSNVPG